MDEIISWSATETAANIRAKKASIEEITQAHLNRIEECEPDLRAVVEPLTESALSQARAKDNETGPQSPPLHGLPTTIKINVDFAGLPNSNGIPALNNNAAASDSPIVTNLKSGGVIPIGRTNTPEFSLRWFTSNPIYGVTKNSVNVDLTPGGSSGGASSAVAAGMGVIAHGNDLGGSLRYPAYCCGLASLRPSMGRVPAFNPSAPTERPANMQMMSVQGTIARTVADVRLAFNVITQRSSYDPLWNNAPDSGRVRGKKLKIGVCVDAFGDGVSAEVEQGVLLASEALKATDYDIVDIMPPMAAHAAELWGVLLNGELHAQMLDAMTPVASEDALFELQTFTDAWGVPDLKTYLNGQADRLTILRAWNLMFDDIDALLMPVSAQQPFLLEQDFRHRDQQLDIAKAQRPLFLANLLGLPAMAVPTGINAGIPMGVQIMAPQRDDYLCLDIAADIERHLALDTRPVDP